MKIDIFFLLNLILVSSWFNVMKPEEISVVRLHEKDLNNTFLNYIKNNIINSECIEITTDAIASSLA